jgi:hypothetical protein
MCTLGLGLRCPIRQTRRDVNTRLIRLAFTALSLLGLLLPQCTEGGQTGDPGATTETSATCSTMAGPVESAPASSAVAALDLWNSDAGTHVHPAAILYVSRPSPDDHEEVTASLRATGEARWSTTCPDTELEILLTLTRADGEQVMGTGWVRVSTPPERPAGQFDLPGLGLCSLQVPTPLTPDDVLIRCP